MKQANTSEIPRKRLLNLVNRLNYAFHYTNPVNYIAGEICDVLSITSAGFFLLDETTQDRYVLVDGKGLLEELKRAARFDIESGLINRMVMESVPLTIDELKNDPFIKDELETLKMLGATTLFPLLQRGNFAGFLVVGTRRDGSRPDSIDLELLQTVANMASVILLNVKLYFRVQGIYKYFLESLSDSIESHGSALKGHTRRVRRLSLQLAKTLGFGQSELEEIELAGMLMCASLGDEKLLNQIRPEQEPAIYRRLDQDVLWQKAMLERVFAHAANGRKLSENPDFPTNDIQPLILAVADRFNRILVEQFSRGKVLDRKAIANTLEHVFVSDDFKDILEALSDLIKNNATD